VWQGGGRCETWPKLQHLQEPPAGASVGRAGRVCASVRAPTIKDLSIHILGNAVPRGPGAQASILGWRAFTMGLTRIHEWCHLESGSELLKHAFAWRCACVESDSARN
jgi:hypothetical protein